MQIIKDIVEDSGRTFADPEAAAAGVIGNPSQHCRSVGLLTGIADVDGINLRSAGRDFIGRVAE
jgi:hypothetical protein